MLDALGLIISHSRVRKPAGRGKSIMRAEGGVRRRIAVRRAAVTTLAAPRERWRLVRGRGKEGGFPRAGGGGGRSPGRFDSFRRRSQDHDLAEAIVDRVLEKGRLVLLDGPSYRTGHLDLPAGHTHDAIHQPARISGKESMSQRDPG